MIRAIPSSFSRTLLRSFSTPTSASLAGTVPFHDSYVLLHTRQPPSSYPGRVKSRLQRTLQLLATQWGGVVNFSWSPEQQALTQGDAAKPEWENGDEEAYRATAFSAYNGTLDIPEVNMRNVEEVNALLSAHAYPSKSPSSLSASSPTLHLYVCTHGERDCRCGDTGGKVYEALRREVKDRGLWERVHVAGVGHVSGHKYAANLLVYPWGEWLGNLDESNISEVFEGIVSRMNRLPEPNVTPSPLCPSYWRGRMGLDKEEQLTLLSRT
ncbi:hypothetical protein NLI96_g7680 [Meripilus lineatus]|uniref:Sucrase/ferredoxin-like-domain-containing protein n=1 Tax=Meripilus lineatus TaxID=2056292 RepID=A0AAD5UYY1_9APHY|nr:hypothetical protein NLI96_g7680 [Physisporinus lineatus]